MFFMSDPACMVAFVHICEYFLCLNGSKAVFVEGQVFPAEGVRVGHPVLIKLKRGYFLMFSNLLKHFCHA